VNPKIKVAVDFIEENLHRDIYVEEIAQLVRLSRSRLSHLFKREVGIPVNQYIDRSRIERAAYSLETCFKPVKSIAFEVGYNSSSHFEQRFRKAFGVTPLEYRSQHIVKRLPKGNRGE
jgi:AraC family transcriptional regulator, arabinose operon regulatory protein